MEKVRKFSKHYYLRQIVACWMICWMAFGIPAQVALADPGPVPGSLPYGTLPGTSPGVSTNTVGSTMNVNSNPGQTVINWRNFDIGNGATVNLNQGSGWVLNQVFPGAGDGMATGILGHLDAPSCGVIVTNPRGIVFGPSAFVSAQSFIASALRMDASKFLSGQFEFNTALGAGAGLTALDTGAQINVEQLGALVGKKVLNMGTVRAGPGGCVVMAAADKIIIGKSGSKVFVEPIIWTNPLNRVVDNGGFNGTGSGTIDAPGADIILAAGDIWSTAIEGVESLRAASYTDIHLNGDVTATGDIDLFADNDHDGTGDMIAADGASILGGADIEIRGNDIVLGGPVAAGSDPTDDLTIVGRDCHPIEWGNVWAKDTLDAGGDISISVTGEKLVRTGWHWEGCGRHRHKVYEYETVYYPGTITLDGDVTAGGNIKLFNDTYTTNVTGYGVTLDAGGNIELKNSPHPYENCTFLQGQNHLGLIAGGQIIAPATVISVTGSTLLMQQNPTLNTASYMFANQANTDLTLISDSGSVISTTGANAANKWKSIGAHASQNIALARSNGKKTIHLGLSDPLYLSRSLWAENGYIDIDGFNVANSSAYPTGSLEAGTTLDIDVVHGINLGGTVTSGGNMGLHADTDTRWGHDVVVGGHINSGGTLDIEGTNVDIQSAHSDSDMDIYAHGLYDASNPAGSESLVDSGDVRVHGALTTTDGHIIIEATEGPAGSGNGPGFEGGTVPYSATGTIYLDKNVTANGSDSGDDVRLLSNTEAKDNVKIKAYDDVYLKNDKSIEGLGDLYVESGDNIELGTYDELNPDGGGSGGEVTTAGNLDMTAGDNVYASGKLTTTGTAGTIGNGDLTVHAGDNIYLNAIPVSADAAGNMTLTADKDIVGGDVDVEGDLLAGGDIEISASDSTIFLAGDVKTKSGGDGDIIFYHDVVADGDTDQIFDADGTGKSLIAHGTITKTTTGHLTLAGDSFGGADDYEIVLYDDVTVTGGAGHWGNLYLGYDGTYSDDTWVAAGKKLESTYGDVRAADRLTGGGALTVEAGDDIWLHGDVSAAGHLALTADAADTQGSQGGDIEIWGEVETTNGGNINAQASDDIKLHQDVTSDGSIYLTADSDNGNYSGAGNLDIDGNLDAKGDIVLSASDDTILIGGDHVIAVGNVTLNDDTVLDGSGTQRIDAVTGQLIAHEDIDKTESGDLELGGGSGIVLGDDVSTSWGNLVFEDAVTANGSGDSQHREQIFEAYGSGKKLHAMSSITKTTSGDLKLRGGWNINYEIDLDGDVIVTGGSGHYGNLYIGSGSDDTTVADGKLLKSTYGDVEVSDRLNGEGDLDIWAADDIRLHGDTTVEDHFKAKAGQRSGRESILYTKNVTAGSMVLESGNRSVDGSNWDDVEVAWGKDLETTKGDLVVRADDHIYLGDDATSAGEMRLLANHDSDDGGIIGNVKVEGDLKASDDIDVKGRNIYLDEDVLSGEDIRIIARDHAYNGMDGDVEVGGTLGALGDITVKATDDITLWGSDWFGFDVSAGAFGDITLKADRGGYPYPYGGDLEVYGNLLAGGDITLDAADHTIHLWENALAMGSIWLKANTKLRGSGDQYIAAGEWIRADGYVRKCKYGDMWLLAWGTDEGGKSIDLRYDDSGPGTSTYKGNLWIVGSGDIQISDDVTTFGPTCYGCPGGIPCSGWETGGVLIYSHDGKIYTAGGADDTLNISVIGNSDHELGLGIYDPRVEEDARAAIAIVSAEDLKIGENAELRAYGRYYDDVDDRAAINFLDYDGSFPPGTPRDQGDPFDLAIYVASTTGDVDVSSPVSIKSREPVFPEPDGDMVEVRPPEPRYVCVPKGTMVIDAWDTVTFDGGVPGGLFETSLADGEVGDRLEVCSRITEWLYQAVGRLPYVGGGGPFPPGYAYVLRGAGADNPSIGDDAPAWVLENPPGPAAPLYQPEFPKIEGCPAEMEAAAMELGITRENIQIAMGTALALNPNIQPCQACRRLLDAAAILADTEGVRFAAMLQIFNDIAPPDAPFTPEMETSIATAFAENIDDAEMPQYATAMEYIDAFVGYIAAQDQLGAPVGDPAAFAMEKYRAPLEESGNANIVSYIQTRLAALGG